MAIPLSLQKIKKLPKETEIYFGHEYTLQNSKFCILNDSKNSKLKEKILEINERLDNHVPTVPSILSDELKCNIFLKAKDLESFSKLRELKHSAIWKSLKSFRLEPGHEVVARIKVKQKNINAFVLKMAELEKEIQSNGHPDFFNGVFVSIAGGFESQTLMVRSITSSASDQGKIADEYFEGNYNTFNEAMALTEGFVSEQIQVCEQTYKK